MLYIHQFNVPPQQDRTNERTNETRMKLISLTLNISFFPNGEKIARKYTKNLYITMNFNKKVIYDKCSHNYIKRIFRRRQI